MLDEVGVVTMEDEFGVDLSIIYLLFVGGVVGLVG